MPVARVLGRRPCHRVLTYHRFAERARDPFAIAPAQFDAQMARLAASGRSIDLTQLLAFLDGRPSNVPDHAVLVTIDDGAASTLEIAAPILRCHGIPAVAFVSAGRRGAKAEDGPERFLDRDEVASLPGYGVEIGSHAVDHGSLGRLDAAGVADQLWRSKHELEALSGREVRAFAYPFGTRRDFNAASRAEAERAGYRACFTSQHGAIRRGADQLVLPRIKIEGGDATGVFDRATKGGLDAWIIVDRTLSRLQATDHGRRHLKTT